MRIWDQIFRQFVYIRLKTNLWNVNECGWISKMNLFGDRPIMVIETQSHRIVTVAMHFGQPFNSMPADACKPERKPSNDDPTIFSFEFSISQRYALALHWRNKNFIKLSQVCFEIKWVASSRDIFLPFFSLNCKKKHLNKHFLAQVYLSWRYRWRCHDNTETTFSNY